MKTTTSTSPILSDDVGIFDTTDLEFKASLLQDSDHPGATIKLAATLKESDTSIQNATVKAKVVLPDDRTATIHYQEIHPGHFKASYQTSLPGVYTFRVHAKGTTAGGVSFTREKTLTGAVYYGD